MPRRYDDDPSNLDRIGVREKRHDDRPDPEERQRKSWRELDKQRDKSSHRSERPSTSNQERGARPESQAYRSYKSQLNKLFDGGAVPDALKEKMDTAKDSKAHKAALDAISTAKTARAKTKALHAFRAEHGFPRDEAVLTQLLDLDDEPEIVAEALRTLEALVDEGHIKRARSLRVRVDAAKMMVDDDDVFEVASRLMKKL